MDSKKVYISPSQYGIIKESEWNFHYGSNHDMRPYVSDSKFAMAGRETGHFGSGTYFSTYSGDRLGEKFGGGNPNFIQIGEHLYRVDFDLYKNLYRVRSKKQGDVLYTMCTELNHMYNKIAYMGQFNPRSASYDNSENYQIIKRNAEALGLDCPSYYELTRMAQNHDGNQSFSTLFMEWNGYNGVNVSGIEYYDNTKHGSVIYDLSKTSGEMKEVDVRLPFLMGNQPYNDTVAYDKYGNSDVNISALKGEYLNWHKDIGKYPLPQAMRILKNYTKSGNVLSPFDMEEMDDKLLKLYLGILFSACKGSKEFKSYGDYSDGTISLGSWFNDRGIMDVMLGDRCKYYVKLIERVGAYYWVNCTNGRRSMLTEMLWGYSMHMDWNLSSDEERVMKEDYLEKLLPYMQRELTPWEKEFIEEDYY